MIFSSKIITLDRETIFNKIISNKMILIWDSEVLEAFKILIKVFRISIWDSINNLVENLGKMGLFKWEDSLLKEQNKYLTIFLKKGKIIYKI
jgi:hypothetical protein